MKIDKRNVIDAFQCCFHLWCVCGCCYCRSYQGDKTKLSYVVSLVLVVAVPMILIMPGLAKLMGLPEDMAGA